MKKKILIVDDSGLARRLTRKAVEELGYEAEEAADGPSALEKFAAVRHDAILLDMVMHGMYGLDVLPKIREIDPKVPVVICTADIQRSTAAQAKEAGAAGLLNKPIDKDSLAEVLARVLKGESSWT